MTTYLSQLQRYGMRFRSQQVIFRGHERTKGRTNIHDESNLISLVNQRHKQFYILYRPTYTKFKI